MSFPAVDLAQVKNSIVTTVSAGSTATLKCLSNDYDHNFMLWLFNGTQMIGPNAHDYDARKYKYEVLSGKLFIDNVTPSESGIYSCLSKKIDGNGFSVGKVEMLVTGSTFSAADAVKLVAIIVSIIVILCSAVLYHRLRKDWKKYDGRTVVSVDDVEDEEGDGDEIYNRTTTSISQPVPGPSRVPSSEHLIYGIDNQGLDTDFNSVFENIQIKTPPKSLI